MLRSYQVGAIRHRCRSAKVGALLPSVGARRRSPGRMIRRIARIVALATSTDRAAHLYQDCGDPDCMMFGCRAYKTGFRDGYDQGYMDGEAAGFAAGFAAGMAAGAK